MSNGQVDKIDFAEFDAIQNMTWRDRLRNVAHYVRWGFTGISTGMSLAGIALTVVAATGVALASVVAPAVIASVTAIFGAFAISVGAYSVYKKVFNLSRSIQTMLTITQMIHPNA